MDQKPTKRGAGCLTSLARIPRVVRNDFNQRGEFAQYPTVFDEFSIKETRVDRNTIGSSPSLYLAKPRCHQRPFLLRKHNVLFLLFPRTISAVGESIEVVLALQGFGPGTAAASGAVE